MLNGLLEHPLSRRITEMLFLNTVRSVASMPYESTVAAVAGCVERMSHLHNLAPRTFPLNGGGGESTFGDNDITCDLLGGGGVAPKASIDPTTNSAQLQDIDRTAARIAKILNPYAGVRDDPTVSGYRVFNAFEYIYKMSHDLLIVHDKRIPPYMRTIYILMLRRKNEVACTNMSIVFNLYIKAQDRLRLYRDILQLSSGLAATYTAKCIPLDRDIRSINVQPEDVFNYLEFYNRENTVAL